MLLQMAGYNSFLWLSSISLCICTTCSLSIHLSVDISVQFSSVTQSCLTSATPWTAAHQASLSIISSFSLTKLMSIESVMPSNHSFSVVPFSFHLQCFPASGSVPMSQYFASGGQSTEVSASASVLPTNIKDWFPLGWTGLIFLQSKGLSRVFSNHSINSSVLSFLYSPTLKPIHTWFYVFCSVNFIAS